MPTLLEKIEMPATVRVEEAFRTPLTNRLEEIVEEAEEINPVPMVSIPVVEARSTVNVPVAVRLAKLRLPEKRALPCTERTLE